MGMMAGLVAAAIGIVTTCKGTHMKTIRLILPLAALAGLGLTACSRSADQNVTTTETVSNTTDAGASDNLSDVGGNASDAGIAENVSNAVL
jgi:hypothetical protein